MAVPFPSVSRMGNLIVNPGGGVPGTIETAMRGPAWWLLDLSPLWGFPDQRAGNVVIPGASGRRAIRRRIDESTYVMPFHITGTITASGSATAIPENPLQGLRDNLDYLYENVHNPPTTATRGGKLILPDASDLTDNIQLALSLGRQTGAEIRAVLAVTVPRGRFGG